MSLESEQTLAHYRLIEKIGEGGMGVVWKATDTTLGREVAIKVLPDAFLADAERLARFEREARMLASLTHTNIAAIHGLEQAGERRFLVLELAEGETLADRIARGPIPFREALQIAEQIAAALTVAHDKGIVHRDLKPANVKITSNGAIKVLDFGLAKIWDPHAISGSGPQLTHSPTITAHMTSAGTILGTAGYMSPEQARGEEVDKRTDIWALGCVLLEMVTGRQVFEGRTVTDVIASVVAREPNWDRLPAETPLGVRRLLRRCLEKDAERRLRDVAGVGMEIREALEAPDSPAAEEAAPPAARSGGLRLWQAVAAFAVLAAVAMSFLWWSNRASPPPVIRATIPAPEGTTFDLDMSSPGLVAISPDGRRLVFTATDEGGTTRLYLRDLDDLEARPVSGADGAAYPFWSPDGRYVAFFTENKLKKIEAEGGPPITLCDASNGKGGTWNQDGVIVFAPAHGTELHRVPAAGGESVPITEVDRDRFNGHRFPQFLPDGEHFVFLARTGVTGSSESRVMVGSLSGGPATELFASASHASYAAGHLFFIIERTLMARPFDVKSHELTGEMFPVAENVIFGPGAARGVFSVSEGDVLAYHAGSAVSGSTLQWFDIEGRRLEALGESDAYQEVRISPDGSIAAVSIVDEESSNQDLWLLDVARGLRDRFTFAEASDILPVWSPDGTRIVFSSDRGSGVRQLYIKAVNEGGDAELLYEDDDSKFPVGWSPDGRYVLYSVPSAETAWDNFAIDIDADDLEPIPLQQSQFSESYSQVSPDGRWMIYNSDASGQGEIYVTAFPEGGRKWQVSSDGGTLPLWSPSGEEIYWIDRTSLMRADVDGSGQVFRVGKVSQVLDGLRLSFSGPYQYDISPDGSRFLVNVQQQATAPPMTLVVGFTSELKR